MNRVRNEPVVLLVVPLLAAAAAAPWTWGTATRTTRSGHRCAAESHALKEPPYGPER